MFFKHISIIFATCGLCINSWAECEFLSEQDVALYDGTLGITNQFVAQHSQHMVGISGGSGAHCSGVFLPGNLVLTADHCAVNVNGTTFVTFNYQLGKDGSLEQQRNFPVTEIIEQGVRNNQGDYGWDYKIIKVGPDSSGVLPSEIYPVARLTDVLPEFNRVITMIGHRGGTPKKIDTGSLLAHKDRGYFEAKDIDIAGGNSGGVLLDDNGYVISNLISAGCGVGGGHSMKALKQVSPTIASLFLGYESEWLSGSINDFEQGILWANTGSSPWKISNNNGDKVLKFESLSHGLSTTAPDDASVVTQPFILDDSQPRRITFNYKTEGFAGYSLKVDILVNGNWNNVYDLTKYGSSQSGIATVDLSQYSGIAKARFRATMHPSNRRISGLIRLNIINVELDDVKLPDYSPLFHKLTEGYSRIVSSWPDANGAGVNHQTGTLNAGDILSGWHRAQWSFKVIDGRFVKISSRSQPDLSLHMQNGSLELGNAPDGWHSAQWELEEVPNLRYQVNNNRGLMNAYRLRNRHISDAYLNLEGMNLQATNVPEDYWSSFWYFDKVE